MSQIAFNSPQAVAAVRLIRERARSGLSPDDVAAELAISRSTLDRLLREAIGQSAAAAITAARLAAVRADLAGTDLPLKAIAKRAGFEAREIVMAAAYPPRGRRGFSRTVRAHDYGLRSVNTTPPPLLVAQIETAAAVAEAGAIAEVDGIDVLFVGPADLERDLAGQPAGKVPDFETCVARVAAAARAAGKAAGILVRNPAELPLRQRQGFSLIAVQSDVALLRDAFRAIVAAEQAR